MRRWMARLGVVSILAPFLGLTPHLGSGGPSVSAAPALATVTPGSSVFAPVTPTRLADTRTGMGYARLGASSMRVAVAGRAGVPREASAVVITLTVADASRTGYLTAYPTGATQPVASNLNFDRGDTIANTAAVPLGSGGAITVFSSVAEATVIVDITGYFVPASQPTAAGRYVPIAAQRLLDTRTAGARFVPGESRLVRFPLWAVPRTAIAVVVNLTYLDATGPGYFTAWPGGPRPDASTGNLDSRSQTRAHLAVVPVGTIDGQAAITLYSSAGAHVIVDMAGYFTGSGDVPGSAGMFVPSIPRRVLDTRTGDVLTPGSVAHLPISGGQAAWLTVTTTGGSEASYVTARPAFAPMPATSALNTSAGGETIANAAVVNLSSEGAQLYTQSGEHLLADLSGVFTGVPTPSRCQLVVLAHGGSYTGGAPSDLGPWAGRFIQAGWRVANLSYRVVPELEDRVWGWWYPRTSVLQDVPLAMRDAHDSAAADLRPQLGQAVDTGCEVHTLGYSSGGSAMADAVSTVGGVASVHLVASAVLDLEDIGGTSMHVWHSANDPIIAEAAAAESCPRWWISGSPCTYHDLGQQPSPHIAVELDEATRWLLAHG